jgi:Ca2+-binding EF-hand superfamily protein
MVKGERPAGESGHRKIRRQARLDGDMQTMKIRSIFRPCAGLRFRLIPALAAGAALLAVTAGLAGGAVAQERAAFDRLDLNKDGVITRAELAETAERLVARLDADRDGYITRAEFMQFQDRLARRRGNALFKRLDANRDGAISMAEAAAAPRLQRGFALLDANGNGRVTRAEYDAFSKRLADRRMARIFGRWDTNRDGRISPEERQKSLDARFMRLDANRDGKVTLQEFGVARERWRSNRDRRIQQMSK